MDSINFIFIGLIALYAALGISIHFLQETLLFHSKSLEQNHQFDFDFDFREENFEMQDGAIINTLFIPTNSSKGVILYFHGNSGNLARWGKIGQYFTQYDYDVLICDYRGYGKSAGKRSMRNLFSDAKALYNILLKDYNEQNIIIYGRSIGSGIACWLASETNAKRLILETPFNSINDIRVFRFLLLPAELLLKYPFPNYKYIKSVQSPISIIHGTKDRIVPYFTGKKLFEQNNKTHDVELITVNGGRHNNLVEFDDFHMAIKRILNNP